MLTKNKRIALCFFGMPPSKCNKGVRIEKDLSYGLWHRNVIKPNDPDIFIHAWGEDDGDDLVKKYNPVSHILEDHPAKYDYDDGGGTVVNMLYSQAYSAKKSIELKKEYEKKHGFKYDLVMICRMDCLWLKSPDLKALDPQKFYISNWNQNRRMPSRPLMGDEGLRGEKSNITTTSRQYRKILDYWFISGTENIDIYGGLYDYIPGWLEEYEKKRAEGKAHPHRRSRLANGHRPAKISNHTLKRDFLVDSGWFDPDWSETNEPNAKTKMIVEFKYFEHYDHNLQRYFYQHADYREKKTKKMLRRRLGLRLCKCKPCCPKKPIFCNKKN